MNYTNAQFRSILNGFGYGYTLEPEPNFPLSEFDGPLVDQATMEAIEDFQRYFNLRIDGIAGPKTLAKAEQAMRILQSELNQVINAGLPQNQPFYGPKTIAAVEACQRRYGFLVDGVASLAVRRKLLELSQLQGVR